LLAVAVALVLVNMLAVLALVVIVHLFLEKTQVEVHLLKALYQFKVALLIQ
jgi:hypothetical protein